jgi:hypothetical protein
MHGSNFQTKLRTSYSLMKFRLEVAASVTKELGEEAKIWVKEIATKFAEAISPRP